MRLQQLLVLLSLGTWAVAFPRLGGRADDPASNATNNTAFTLNVRWSNTLLRGPIYANAGVFWVGKVNLTSVCPQDNPDCSGVNTTSFKQGSGGRLFMNVNAPGGQQVYASPNGRLSYTSADKANNSSGISADSLVDFGPVIGSFLNPFLTFMMCNSNADKNVWSVWLEYYNGTSGDVKTNGKVGHNACTRVMFQTVPYHGEVAYAF